ncbi:MAG: hypothetical protein U0414_08780 [Polyangiaceae bacterium]
MSLLRAVFHSLFGPKLPDDVAPSEDAAALERWIAFPVQPTSIRWRGVGQASSGRVGALWYEVHALLGFEGRWGALRRALATMPVHRGGPGTQHWHEFLPKDVMPLVEGPTHARGPYYGAKSWWRHPTWACTDNAWANALGDGPWVLACWSTVSVPSW